jgi:hypothetical protein
LDGALAGFLFAETDEAGIADRPGRPEMRVRDHCRLRDAQGRHGRRASQVVEKKICPGSPLLVALAVAAAAGVAAFGTWMLPAAPRPALGAKGGA